MEKYAGILRYMGHSGSFDKNLEMLISSSLERLDGVCDPRYVKKHLSCTVTEDRVTINMLKIESRGLAARLINCTHVYIFAATLGAAVDRLITQRTKIDSAEALCLQACAAARLEDYCDSIEKEILDELKNRHLHLRPRFSPGYCDFNIAHQTDVLLILQAHKFIGVTETKAHMLTPLKSVTALVGIGPGEAAAIVDRCFSCGNRDCQFYEKRFEQ